MEEVESTGTATVVDIQQTTQVKAGDCITAIGSSDGKFEYIALGEGDYDAASIVAKVQETTGKVRLQLERPLQKVNSFTLVFTYLHLSLFSYLHGCDHISVRKSSNNEVPL